MTPSMQSHAAVRDLTDPAQQSRVLHLADELVANPDRLDHVLRALGDPAATAHADPIEIEAAACASSAHAAQAIASPVHVSIVWAMYNEADRIRRRDQHEHGEDFLFEKLRQIEWLADHNSLLTWDLVAVDDGCPSVPSSADVATELVFGTQLQNRVTVLRLSDAIGRRLPVSDPFNRLTCTDDSRKGGAITYGMWAAISGRAGTVPLGAEHVVLYTDADLSTNLAQAAPLILATLNGAAAAAGQRYGAPGAVLVKPEGPMTEPASTGTKPDRTIIVFRHWVRSMLLPDLADVVDTQAGFKAFRADVLAAALPRLDAFTESFDAELLLHAAAVAHAPIAPLPLVFTEDFAATNFPSVEPQQRHLDMLTQLVEIHDRLVAGRTAAARTPKGTQALRTLLRRLDLDGYIRIINGLKRAPDSADHDFSSTWTVAKIAALAAAN